MIIKETYDEFIDSGCDVIAREYTWCIDDKKRIDYEKYEMDNILKNIVKVENVKLYMERLRWFHFNLKLTSTDDCDTCGNYNCYYSGKWKCIEINFYEHCFGTTVNYNCDDDKMLDLLIENIQSKKMLKVILEDYDAEYVDNCRVFRV